MATEGNQQNRARFPLSYISKRMREEMDHMAGTLGVSTSQYVLQILSKHLEIPEDAPKKKEKKAKAESRPQAWSRAAGDAGSALDELISLQEEYRGWLDNMPEGLKSSPTGEKLEEVCNIDLESARSAIEEAEGVDLPRGFGND